MDRELCSGTTSTPQSVVAKVANTALDTTGAEGKGEHNVPGRGRRRSAARAAVKHCKEAGHTLTFTPCDPPAARCLDALAHCSGACCGGTCVDVPAVRAVLVDAQHGRCYLGRHRAVRGLDSRAVLRRSAGAAPAWRDPRSSLAGEAVGVAGYREHRSGRRDRCRGQPVDLGAERPRAPLPPKRSRDAAEADRLSGGAARGWARGAATQIARRDDRQASGPGATGVPAPRAGDRRPLPLRRLADGHAAFHRRAHLDGGGLGRHAGAEASAAAAGRAAATSHLHLGRTLLLPARLPLHSGGRAAGGAPQAAALLAPAPPGRRRPQPPHQSSMLDTHAKHMPNTRQTHAEHVPNTCRTHAEHVPSTCPVCPTGHCILRPQQDGRADEPPRLRHHRHPERRHRQRVHGAALRGAGDRGHHAHLPLLVEALAGEARHRA
eukprot:scaffold4498_cov60-Phaeocystis_antarctica.AAC.4